jgi:thiol:disulfide interchange protein
MTISTDTISTRHDLAELLKHNQNVVILKLGAEWCGPCKTIEKDVETYMNLMPESMTCMILDVDNCFDLYAYLKSKKIVQGIPCLLAYYKDNTHYAPNEIMKGTNMGELKYFFDACLAQYGEYES